MEERISRRRFIRLGTVLGVGAAGASVLAACGGGTGGAGKSGGKASGHGSGGGGGYGGRENGGNAKTTSEAKTSGEKASGAAEKQAPSGRAIAQTSEVAPGSAVKFKDSGSPAVLVHLQSGKFVAYSAVCTHQGCTVAYKNGLLACPCHGSVFDPSNGAQVVAGPAPRPLPGIPVKVRGGDVFRA